jgi:serine/threonine-protein kinase
MTQPTPELPRRASVALLVTSFATLALAIFQWIELVIVRRGGHSVCSINAHVNCEAVWNSDLASRVHSAVGVPVAGLGAIWALAAFVLALFLTSRARAKRSFRAQALALRITALVGVLSVITFGIGSFRAGALCLLCLCTYVLVAAFAFFAFAWLPGPLGPQEGEGGRGLGWAVGAAVIAYLIALGPGLATPHAQDESHLPIAAVNASTANASTSTPAAPGSELAQFLARLPDAQKQAVSDSLALWKTSTAPSSAGSYPPAARYGSPDAPVKLVEFTDIACPHCKHLVEALAQLRQVVPPEKLSVESRYYPLDAECNPTLPPNASDHSGLRCLGAKVQICLEGAPDFIALRDKLFEAQQGLTPATLIDIASSGATSRPVLEACVGSPQTAQRLQQDIQYAQDYKIQGTPLVLLNGHEGMPIPAFILAVVLADGNPNAPAFAALPPPEPMN